jgi:two-component system, cell cycle sensor histidine kinase and response regulator CckA
MKIMVVTANLTVAHDLPLVFSHSLDELEIVENEETGFQQALRDRYDLIALDTFGSLDISVSKVDGIALCQRLREQHYQLPILIFSGSSHESDGGYNGGSGDIHAGMAALNAGADDYVTGPFNAENFVARVALLLHRSRNSTQQQVQLYKALVENSPDIIERFDTHLRHLYVSPGLEALTGIPADQVVGKTCRELGLPVDMVDRWEAAAHQLLSTGQKQTIEFETPTPVGLQYFEMKLVPELTQANTVESILCISRDISDRKLVENDRKQGELQLQQQLDRARIVAELNDSIRQTLELDKILCTAVNQVRRLLQTDRVVVFRFQSHWQGTVEAESVAPEWSAILSMKIQDACLGDVYVGDYRLGRVSAISDIYAAEIDSYHRQMLKGLQVKANLVVPILQDDNLWGLLIAHHCRTPREWDLESTQLLQQVATQLGIAIQQAELYQKMREQAALIDITTDAIFVRDLAGQIILWSQGAERLYGWYADEAMGKNAHHLLKKGAQAELEAAFTTTLNQGFWQGELTQRTKADDEILVASRWTLIRDALGHPKSLLEVNTDITDKKRLEAQFYQAQRLESLGQLASGIAHDLGNMLTPILGIAQLLRITQKDMDSATQRHLELLETSAKRGVNMVKQIVTFAQGSEDEEKTIVDVVSLLQEVIDVAQQGCSSAIEICQNVSPQLHAHQSLKEVSADSTHLHQVFMNLCINARDAMPKGGTLTLSVDRCFIDKAMAKKSLDASVGHYIVVTVADTGTGISPEIRDRIFDPFFTTKAPDKGTGLGLATVLGIIKNAGGFLTVTSEVGQGTQINVYLPALN